MYHRQPSQQQFGSGQHHRMPMDPMAARLKEQQRRKQQEYSRALAQQVQQRELQKQHERGLDRQAVQTNHHRPVTAERGFFDGLGNNDQQKRTNFARGQRAVESTQPHYPQQHNHLLSQQQLHHQGLPGYEANEMNHYQNPYYTQFDYHHGIAPPPEPMDQHPREVPTHTFTNTNNYNGFGLETFHYGNNNANPPSSHPSPMRQELPQHNQHQLSVQQHQLSHPNSQAPGPSFGGRRVRTDIHNVDAREEQMQRKLQQQQSMQHALQQQIEEKKRQKLEAKRKQEEEDRREMEQFAADQRRQQQELEQQKEEKRRKAEEDMHRAQALAAATAAAAADQHLTKRQQLLHKREEENNPTAALTLQQDPFSNSRAHLFEDPPPEQDRLRSSQPRLNKMDFQSFPDQFHRNVALEHQRQSSPTRQRPTLESNMMISQQKQHMGNNLPEHMHPHHSGFNELRHEERGVNQVLLRQYDDMKQELLQQKQLVEQLQQAHMQIQQQQQQWQWQQQQQQAAPLSQSESGNIPTLSDLEQLRNELREELEHRELLHRQELEEMKRQQALQRQQQLPLPVRLESEHLPRESCPSVPFEQDQFRPERHYGSNSSELHQGDTMSMSTTTKIKKIQRKLSLMERSITTAQLNCDSKFVYFDGRVGHQQEGMNDNDNDDDEEEKEEERGGELLGSRASPGTRADISTTVETQRSIRKGPIANENGVGQLRNLAQSETETRINRHVNNQDESLPSTQSGIVVTNVENDAEEGDDSLTFFVKDFHMHQDDDQPHGIKQTKPKLPSNYRYSPPTHIFSSSSWTRNYFSPSSGGKVADHWILDLQENDESDEDGDVDASLDGDQLEAIFQRNVRRHEILLGFQAKHINSNNSFSSEQPPQLAKAAWMELHNQLEANTLAFERKLNQKKTPIERPEESLVASSRWMPSTLVGT